MVTGWGTCNQATPCPADINRDGEVDVDDLVSVILAWGLGDCM